MFFLANSSLDLALFEYFHQTKLIYQNILIIWLKFQIQQELWFIDVHLFTFNCNIFDGKCFIFATNFNRNQS